MTLRESVPAVMFLAFTVVSGITANEYPRVCTTADDCPLIEGLPIPETAHEIERYDHGDPGGQGIQFMYEDAYPSTAMVGFYEDHFESQGWTKCRARINDWFSYLDEDGRMVHKVISHWVHWKEHKSALLAVMYRSSRSWRGEVPDSTLQHVTVHMAGGGTGPEAAKALRRGIEWLELVCPTPGESQQ